MLEIKFDETDPEATADALVEVLRAAIQTNATVVHDAHAGSFVVMSLTRGGRSRTHRIRYDGEVTVRYGDFLPAEDLTRR